MKKLTNVSPFILLLVPVFVMMILTFATVKENENGDVALKTTSSVPAIKAAISWIK
jgi:hypothetical protein